MLYILLHVKLLFNYYYDAYDYYYDALVKKFIYFHTIKIDP